MNPFTFNECILYRWSHPTMIFNASEILYYVIGCRSGEETR